MLDNFTTEYTFLVFNKATRTLLAHGSTAAHAMLKADKIAPHAHFITINAGATGEDIWKSWVAAQAIE